MISIEERINSLERQNRRMKLIGAAVVVIVAAFLLVGWVLPAPRVVEAEMFVLKNSNGQEFGGLGCSPEGITFLTLLDKDRTPCVTLGSKGDGSTYVSLQQNGTVRAGLTVNKNGAPTLGLSDRKGRSRAALQLDSNGFPSLLLSSEKEENTCQLAEQEDGSFFLNFFGKDSGIALGLDNTKNPTLRFYHGRQMMVGLTALEKGSELALSDESGFTTILNERGVLLADKPDKKGRQEVRVQFLVYAIG